MTFYIRDISYLSAIGLPSGAMLTLGGELNDYSWDSLIDEIWRLMNNKWSLIGSLAKVHIYY